uniref:Uncharacterized protein n=1 Tax=Tanacetum cinerariifolium TaxID=118510 RepID=A0A6L2J7I4_TANCI|nr:hypothetical protein [Tanacetum cinerariifolium]
MGEGSAQPTNTQHTPTFDMPPPKPKKTQKPRKPKRKTTKAITTASSLEAEQDSGNIDKTQTKATSNEPSSQGTSSGDGPRRQDTIGDTSAHTRYERVSKMSSDSLLAGVNTPQKDELKRTKTAQQTKIDGLESRVKKLKKKHMSRAHKLKRLYKVGLTARIISSYDDEALDKKDTSKQGRIDEIDDDEDIALEEVVEVVTTAKMIIDVVVDATQVTIVVADISVSAAETIVTTALTITAESTKTNVEVTQTPKRKVVMIQEPEETTTTKTASLQQPQVQDKGKGKAKLIEEPEMPKKRKHQIRADKKLAKKLQAEMQAKIDEEDMLAREKSQKLHEEEQLQLTDAEKAKLFMDFIEKRRKFFAAKRNEKKRNKPPTKAQQRSIMSTYLKNMDGWKLKSFKNKSFAEIQKLFDIAIKRVNTFVDYRAELVVEGSKKDEVREVFKQGDDPIDAINHMMSFLLAVVISRYPTTNNQLRNSSNPRQQATINDGRVTLQPVQERQIYFATGTTRTYTQGASESNSKRQMIVICYNYKGEGHMSKHFIKPKRKRDDAWFKDKVLLVQAQENGQIPHEEELAFLADPGIAESQAYHYPQCTLSNILVEVHNPDNMDNNMINQGVQAMSSSEQSSVLNHSETDITSDSNIISYSQYMHETQQAAV